MAKRVTVGDLKRVSGASQKTRKMIERAARQVQKQAEELAGKVDATWIDVHNKLFGIGGEVFRRFPDQAARVQFSKTDAFTRINELLVELQKRDRAPDGSFHTAALAEGSSGKLNIRLPRSIHAALLAEAEAEDVSLNQLCVAKLCVQLRAGV